MAANPLTKPLELLETAHAMDTQGRYDPDTGDDGDEVPPHNLELAVATRMAIEPGAANRGAGAIFGFKDVGSRPTAPKFPTPFERRAHERALKAYEVRERQANREAGRRLTHALAGRQDTGGRLPARGTQARKTYDAAAREGQRWRRGTRHLGPRYQARLLFGAIQRYVSTPPGSAGIAKLNRLSEPGDVSVTFTGDYQLRNPSPPPEWLPVRVHKQITAQFRSYEVVRDLKSFTILAKRGDWYGARRRLEEAFWPVYFTDAKGSRSGNIGQWIHPDGPLKVSEQ
jgi:hypothetical protein